MIASLRRLGARAIAFFRGARLEDDFGRELESHMAMLADDNVRRGMTPEHARRDAMIRLGNPESLKEQHRGVRGLPALDSVLQDVRFAFRLIARERRFSAAAIAAIALGVGANATGFSLVNSVFLRGLPFEDADRLYALTWQARSGRRSNVSYPELQDWRARSASFEGLAATRYGPANLSDDHALAERARGAWVTANALDVLRQPPLFGRGFGPGDERPGADPVVVIGETVWRNRYGRDPNVLGGILRVNGVPATIVGVMPEAMRFPDNTSVWLPFIPSEVQKARDARVLAVFGRLRDGIDRCAALAEMNAIGPPLVAAHPGSTKDLSGTVRVETFNERAVGGPARPMFYTVMGAVVFVLLIACANVASLLLSRSTSRAREIGMRTALGASRGRVIRQLLTESLVLSSIGGGIGLLLAVVGVRMFDAIMPPVMPYWITFDMDFAVFAYVAGICIVTAVLFGLAPALHLSRAAGSDVLKDGGRGVTGGRRSRWLRSTLVVAELALTIVLLAGAGLMIRSFVTLYSIDLGIDSGRLLTMRMQLPESTYANAGARRAFFDRLEPRLAAISGVEAAALTNGVPPHDGGERFLEVDRPPAAGIDPVMVGTVTITPAFFDVVGVPVLRGRAFHGTDGAPGAETVIINERLAEQFYPGENPIGRRLRFTQRGLAWGQSKDVWRTIVGICPSIGHGSAEDRYANAVVYIPYRQESLGSVSLLLRAALPPVSVMESVRLAVQSIDRDLAVLPLQTAADVVAETQWWYRVWGGVFGAIAVIALVLSSFGLYAVIAYSVTQRTQEIGVRIAIGARPGQVIWLILERGLAQLAVGLPLGLAAALGLARVLWSRGVGPIAATDPLTFGAITVVLTTVAIAACVVPARRAARIDPVVALRAE